MEEDTEANSRWQPIMIVMRGGGRLECECGALAVIAIGTVTKEYNQLDNVDHYCQSCYLKAQQEAVKE